MSTNISSLSLLRSSLCTLQASLEGTIAILSAMEGQSMPSVEPNLAASGNDLEPEEIFSRSPGQPQPQPFAPVGKTRRLASEWPKLGSADLIVEASSLFDRAAYLDVYRPGETREIYTAACTGLSRLARTLNLPTYKIGECGRGRMPDRMRELSSDRYGSAWYQNDVCVSDDDFTDYFPSNINFTLKPSPNSPVKLSSRSLSIVLPHTLSPEEFSSAFVEVLDSASLTQWLKTAEGIRHCKALGIDAAFGRRLTAYAWGDRVRLSPATELYCARTRYDGDRLLAIAEAIVLRHLGLAESGDIVSNN